MMKALDPGQLKKKWTLLTGHAGSQNQRKAKAQNIENGHKQTNKPIQHTLEAKA